MLQAFRHLYVLATEPRFVEAIDVDSRASVYVPLTVTMHPSPQVTTLGLYLSSRSHFCPISPRASPKLRSSLTCPSSKTC